MKYDQHPMDSYDGSVGRLERPGNINESNEACGRPSQPFESTIGWAILEIHRGKKLMRRSWNGKGMHISIQYPDLGSKMSQPYIYMKTADNQLVPWTASQSDLLACDWAVVRE